MARQSGWLLCVCLCAVTGLSSAEEVVVRNYTELVAAVNRGPGTTVLVSPGVYRRWSLSKVHGTKAQPIVIRALDPKNRPVINDSADQAIWLPDAQWLTIKDVVIRGSYTNAITVYTANPPSPWQVPLQGTHDLTFENIDFYGVRRSGNTDGIHAVYVDNLMVRNSRFHQWGDGGQAIDLLNTRHAMIEDCEFYAPEGAKQGSAVSAKRESSHILIRKNFFQKCSYDHAIQLGHGIGAKVNATDVVVAGNRFVGSGAPMAYRSSDRVDVHHNTIVLPEHWLLRIQGRVGESNRFRDNLIVFDMSLPDMRPPGWVFNVTSVDMGELKKHFRFEHNAWYQIGGAPLDVPSVIPVQETDGVYGVDPKLDSMDSPTMRITSKDSRLAKIGADAYVVPEPSTSLLLRSALLLSLIYPWK